MKNPLLLPAHVYELRIPTSRYGTDSGYFNEADLLQKATEDYDGRVPGIYFTMNPVVEALLARANSRIQIRARTTTSDKDILKRVWLLVDCDAVRPAEISATDTEHDLAIERCRIVAAWLRDQGWPDPIVCDSGNGGHLLYRVDLPNDAESTKLVKAILEVLALKFNDDSVIIDTAVHNAARITKWYGSMVCKGDHTEDRPHRRSRFLTIPEPIVLAPIEPLRQLAAQRPEDPKPAFTHLNGRFDLQAFLDRHHLDVHREKPWHSGATVYELTQCPFNPEHQRGESSIIQYPSGAVSFQCFHNSCQGRRWQDVRDLYEPHRSGRPTGPGQTNGTGWTAHADEECSLKLVRASTVTMKPVQWIIEGRVPLRC
jgi:hypothetical protein